MEVTSLRGRNCAPQKNFFQSRNAMQRIFSFELATPHTYVQISCRMNLKET